MRSFFTFSAVFFTLMAGGEVSAKASVVILPPRPPMITVSDLRADEKPIEITKSECVVAENAYFQRVKTCFTFTNPNLRSMAGELEVPIPEGAMVCGHALEIKGEMVPGVVCEKEKARVTFENEVRKGVDPGIVEQVKGNLWKTRIFPLACKTPRRTEVEYLTPIIDLANAPQAVLEGDGTDYFLATQQDPTAQPNIRESIVHFNQGVILWDASLSAKPFAAAWRERLTALPETGDWQLCFFRNVPSHLVCVKTRAEVLAQIDQCVYDGGTNLAAALKAVPQSAVTLLFSDEMDSLGLNTPNYESQPGLIIASREEAPQRAIAISKLTEAQARETGLKATESTLLATMWAARRMQDLAAQADQRKDEFLALGRRYGVAGPGLSLIVLETLEQWVEHKIEPPKTLALHAAWVKCREMIDDPIAEKKAKAEHEEKLLRYWEERVTWWKNPKPPKRTPSSGLFDATLGVAPAEARNAAAHAVAEESADEETEAEDSVSLTPAPVVLRGVHGSRDPILRGARIGLYGAAQSRLAKRAANEPESSAPSVTLKAWDPKTPYLDAIKAAPMGENYAVYLKQRETYADSPAFYLDCANWFFKEHGDAALAERIITNLAEFKLEDAKLWRTMGWRLREAGRYELAVHVFRKVLTLRGEEGQSYRDLALVLMEQGKALFRAGDLNVAVTVLTEAMQLLEKATFGQHTRRSGRRGNDLQVAIIALEELNGLISWVEAQTWPEDRKPEIPAFDAVYRRDLPVKLRIVMGWDTDETDIDLHVLEPNGEEAYYGHRRTSEGGFVSEDVTTGYGPEEYLKKDLEVGTYKILANYFSSHQTELTGAAIVTATIYTDWATGDEKQQIITLRLDKPKDKFLIGEVTLTASEE
jgi:tetratricopeptide (TPR) repeat protein